jgi:hypothetical protein
MSYDYMLYRPAPGAPDVPEGPAHITPLGTYAEVAQRVEGLFPGIEWERRGHGGDRAWWGIRSEPYVEVRLRGIDPADTLVSFVWLARVERATVEHTADALALVALDVPKGIPYRPGAGWKR